MNSGASAVVLEPVAWLYTEPDERAPVETQAVLGTAVDLLQIDEARRFARVRLPDRGEAWISVSAIRERPAGASPYAANSAVEVASPRANLYVHPSFTAERPRAVLAMGTRLELAPDAPADDARAFVAVRLPDATIAYIAAGDARPFLAGPPHLDPQAWLALGRRLLGTPYTWGGTTPFGFDCSGLIQFLFARHGVPLRRNSGEQCGEEPQLGAVELDAARPGDLIFFGEPGRIGHVAMWVDGTPARGGAVLEATRDGEPGTKVSSYDSPRLRGSAVCARRLRALGAR